MLVLFEWYNREYDLQMSDIYNYAYGQYIRLFAYKQIKKNITMRQASKDKGKPQKSLIFQLKSQIYKLKQDYRQYKHNYTDLLKKHNITLSNISRENKLKKEGYQEIKQEKKTAKFELEWDKKAPNARKFKIKGKRVQRISMDNQSASLFSLIPLPKQGKYMVTFIINKNNGNYAISFGIITSKWKNQVILKNNRQSVFYYSLSDGFGSLTIDRTTIVPFQYNKFGTSEGGEIEMVVDLDQWQIMFTRKETYQQNKAKKIVHCLTESFLDKDLYIFVRMYNYQDEVQIV